MSEQHTANRADSTSRPPWSHLSEHKRRQLDEIEQDVSFYLTSAAMYYLASRLTQHADDIENGEDSC